MQVPAQFTVLWSAPLLNVENAPEGHRTFHFSTKQHVFATNTIGIAIGKFCSISLGPYAGLEIPVSIFAPNLEVLVEAAVEFGPFDGTSESNVFTPFPSFLPPPAIHPLPFPYAPLQATF
jgi:hypothetical protein